MLPRCNPVLTLLNDLLDSVLLAELLNPFPKDFGIFCCVFDGFSQGRCDLRVVGAAKLIAVLDEVMEVLL